MSKKGANGDVFFFLFFFFFKMDNIFLPKKKNCRCPTGHKNGHPLDRKHFFLCGQPQWGMWFFFSPHVVVRGSQNEEPLVTACEQLVSEGFCRPEYRT